MPWTAKLTVVSFTGAWLAVMVKVADPPWTTEGAEDEMVRTGSTDEVMVVDTVDGLPT